MQTLSYENMDYKLVSGEENNHSVYTMKFQNHEGKILQTPSRAFKRVSSVYDDSYFTEIFIPIRSSDLKDEPGYQEFDKNINSKLKKKEVKGNINIISFYGDQNTDIKNLVKFEDLGLLSDFETLFNDHLIAMPYSLSLQKSNFDAIYDNVKDSFDTFFNTLATRNLFGYIPAYIRYREIEKFIDFYSGKSFGTVNDNGTLYNAIPLFIDFKRSSPDSFMRSVAMLHRLKRKYLNEGYYPIYYAANVSRPRTSDKKLKALAKEFMLSFLGFDIIGASQAVPPRQGGGGPATYMDFEMESFSYIRTENKGNTHRTDQSKANIFHTQTTYLNGIHENTSRDGKYLVNELEKRKEAKDYVDIISGR